jgi:hypothetical protein
MLGIADNAADLQFRFDSAKPMGKAVANNPSHALSPEEFLVHLPFESLALESAESKSGLIDLWESICEQVQQNLANESDDRIFRLLIPSFEMFVPPQPSRAQ